jgi:diadenosine tetraphosphatase ApaH/serine/threonine PP2A family protein phosphatase
MVLALLSDVHANLEALEACLRHAHGAGAKRYAFLGDLAGYGADPEAVVATVKRYVVDGAIAVQGNHDEAIERPSGYMNEMARDAIEWQRQHLSAGAKAFLAGLPLCVREDAICFVHASAAIPEHWDYVDSPAEAARSAEAAQTPYTFSGHVHVQELYFGGANGRMSLFRPVRGTAVPVPRHRRWLALVGSVGQPRDGNPAAAYALFDVGAAKLTFHRVPYDYRLTAEKIRRSGLPHVLAYRIEQGI